MSGSMTRRTLLSRMQAAALCGMASSTPAAGQASPSKVELALAGKSLLYFLPVTVAERKRYFEEAGLNVQIHDFAGGARSVQALVGGSVDVVAGAYEHTIRMQARGQDIRAVIELGRFPGIVLAVRKILEGRVKRPADLKGARIGVTALGSSTNFFASYVLNKDGVRPQEVSYVAVGSGPASVAAMIRGEIDAISTTDPVIAKLEQDDQVFALADSRGEAGNQAVFGGPHPAGALFAKFDYIEARPMVVQALVDSLLRSLSWLAGATAEDVAQLVPEEYHLGDRGLTEIGREGAVDLLKNGRSHSRIYEDSIRCPYTV